MKGNTVVNVLVIWSELPDNAPVFVPLLLTNKEALLMENFHNQYINGNASKETDNQMNEFFYTDKFDFKFKKITEPISNKAFDLIICCGFIV